MSNKLIKAMERIEYDRAFEKDLIRFSEIKNVEETAKKESKRIDGYIIHHKNKEHVLNSLISMIRSKYFLDHDSYNFYEKIIETK